MRNNLSGMAHIGKIRYDSADMWLAMHDSTNCLTRGDTCVYDRLAVQKSQSSPQRAVISNVMFATPVDPFDTLEVEMPYDTPRLLHHCKSIFTSLYNVLVMRPVLPYVMYV